MATKSASRADARIQPIDSQMSGTADSATHEQRPSGKIN